MTDEGSAARLKQAALQAVADQGFAGLTPEGLCRRAGATRSQFDQRWSDAGDVLCSALDERLRLPELPDLGSLSNDLAAYIQAYLDRCSDPTLIACVVYVLANARSDRQLGPKLLADFNGRRADNHTLIRRAQARGELPAGVDPDPILDGVLRLGFSWMAAGTKPSTEELKAAIEDLLTREVRSRSSAPRS